MSTIAVSAAATDPVLDALAALSWRARLQPTEPGWLDLALSAPLLRSQRAHEVLGWQPGTKATDALSQLVAGTASSALRRRDSALTRLSGLLHGRVTRSARRT